MAQDPGQYENTQEVEVVLNDPRIKASIPSLLRYLSTKQNIVTVIAADSYTAESHKNTRTKVVMFVRNE